MRVVARAFEAVGIPALTLWALNHFQASENFTEAMSGALVGLVVLWLIAWAIPDGASFADPSIEQREKVFGRSGSSSLDEPDGPIAADTSKE